MPLPGSLEDLVDLNLGGPGGPVPAWFSGQNQNSNSNSNSNTGSGGGRNEFVICHWGVGGGQEGDKPMTNDKLLSASTGIRCCGLAGRAVCLIAFLLG